MIFDFKSQDGLYRYEFHFTRERPKYVEIRTYTNRIRMSGPKCWLHLIKDGKIIWRYDDWMDLTQDAKNYVSHLVKLRAFL